MTQAAPVPANLQQLHDYYEADTRYSIVPIPAPVDRAVAEAFCKPLIVRNTGASKLEKLSRLCILHNLAGTTRNWEALIAQPSERNPTDVEKTSHVIATLAWIGAPEQWKKADDYYKGLFKRSNPDESRGAMYHACDALGPAEGTADLRTWAKAEADRLEALANKKVPGRSPEEENNLHVRADQIRQFANLDLAVLDKEFAVRKAVDALPTPQEKAVRLAAIYCEIGNESGAGFFWWSANKMVRLAEDPAFKTAVVDALFKIARDHAKIDKNKQPELDATRARALRAVLYFGATLPEEDHKWLLGQQDVGTDILTLRPDWKYPAPHGHN
jgi:hypothetical protein